MDTVHINLGNDSYDVIIDSGIIGRLGKETAPLSGHGRAVIITEEGIDELYGQDLKRQLEKENLNVQQIVLSSSEKSRSLSVVSRVCEALADFGFCAGDLLIGLGGQALLQQLTGEELPTCRCPLLSWHRSAAPSEGKSPSISMEEKISSVHSTSPKPCM